jgi:glucose-1-phosphate adenylyltransferase
VKDIISKKLHQLLVYGYEHQGYLAIINTLNSYYRHHFELLNPEVWKELFFRHGVIYTKHKDGPPTKYTDLANASNTMVANGCRIEGMVENSIIFRNVYIAKGASVKNCIIMPKVEIEEDVTLNGVILDKDVLIRKGTRLIGEKDRPVVVGKKQVI